MQFWWVVEGVAPDTLATKLSPTDLYSLQIWRKWPKDISFDTIRFLCEMEQKFSKR